MDGMKKRREKRRDSERKERGEREEIRVEGEEEERLWLPLKKRARQR